MIPISKFLFLKKKKSMKLVNTTGLYMKRWKKKKKKKSWVFLRSSQLRRYMKTQAAIFWGLSLPPMGPMTRALGYLQRSSLSAPPEDKHPRQTCKGLSGSPFVMTLQASRSSLTTESCSPLSRSEEMRRSGCS